MKYCRICGSPLTDEALFCTNCGAACEDETENTTVLDEEFVETALPSTDVEETSVLSQDDNEGTSVPEETTVLSSEHDDETTILSQESDEKITIGKQHTDIESMIHNEESDIVHKHNGNELVFDKKQQNKRIIVICIVLAVVLIIGTIVGVVIVNSRNNNPEENSNNIITEELSGSSDEYTETTTKTSSEISKDGRTVSIISITGNGMTSQDAKVSYNGYETEVTDSGNTYYTGAEGLCIHGTLKYSDESFFDDYEGHGGEIYDKNGEVLEWENITEHNQMSDDNYDANYDLTFYSSPNAKVFCVGLPEDIIPGVYTIELYQFYGENETRMDIKIEVK